jgi:phospholipid/cholesterol/gamma-HCH transport system substrate-binding protein
MDRDANYVAVGAFVVVVLAMATVFVLWYSHARERREYEHYEVYFAGSVSGLNEGSTVRYLGVNVGRVARIRLDARAADRVQVLVDVDKSTPVTRNTLARLSLQGVTGLLFIDLAHAPPDMRDASPEVPGERYPVIRSMPSNFDLFVSGLPGLVAEATRATTRVNELLAEPNIAAVSRAVENLRAASEPLPGATRDAARLVAELRAAVAEAQGVAAGANRLIAGAGPELGTAARRLRELSEHLAGASARVDGLLARHEPELDRFAGQGLAELQQLMRESRDAAGEIRELAHALREDPSSVLYEHPAAGVEIAR